MDRATWDNLVNLLTSAADDWPEVELHYGDEDDDPPPAEDVIGHEE